MQFARRWAMATIQECGLLQSCRACNNVCILFTKKSHEIPAFLIDVWGDKCSGDTMDYNWVSPWDVAKLT